MVVKPNGKVEHADDAHDDLIFSYLWALYVFYYGEDLANRYHLMKTEIYTDDNYDETSFALDEEYSDDENTIVLQSDVFNDKEDPSSKMVDDQLKLLNRSRSMSLEDFYKREKAKEDIWTARLMTTKSGREAISKAYNIPKSHIDKQAQGFQYIDISNDINNIFYSDNPNSRNIYDPDYTGKTPDDIYEGNLKDMFRKV